MAVAVPYTVCVGDNGSSPFCEHLYVLGEYLKQISLEDATDIMS